jgi:hypothetical protein
MHPTKTLLLAGIAHKETNIDRHDPGLVEGSIRSIGIHNELGSPSIRYAGFLAKSVKDQ